MNTRIPVLISMLAAFITGIATLSYASERLNLVDTRVVDVEKAQNNGVRFTKTFVYQEGDELIITGKLKRSGHHYIGSGFVNISIVGPDGNINKQLFTTLTPGYIRKNPTRGARFTVRLPFTPPHGSKVRLSYQRLLKTGMKTFQCDSDGKQLSKGKTHFAYKEMGSLRDYCENYYQSAP